MHEPTGQGFPKAENPLDRLRRLKRSHQSWENAKDSTFSTTRDQTRLRWRGKETAIAGASLVRGENTHLSLKLIDRSVNIGDLKKVSHVIAEIACGEVVRAIDDQIIATRDVHRIARLEEDVMAVQGYVRIDLPQSALRRLQFLGSNVSLAVKQLPMKVRSVHRIRIDQP